MGSTDRTDRFAHQTCPRAYLHRLTRRPHEPRKSFLQKSCPSHAALLTIAGNNNQVPRRIGVMVDFGLLSVHHIQRMHTDLTLSRGAFAKQCPAIIRLLKSWTTEREWKPYLHYGVCEPRSRSKSQKLGMHTAAFT